MSKCPFRKPEDINFMDPLVQENWFEAYEVLHAQAPVYFMPECQMYVVTKYEDLREILHDPETFLNDYDDGSSEALIHHPEAQALYREKGWPRLMPLSSNLPEHRAYRGMIDGFFTAGAAKAREPLIRRVIDELIDSWIDQGEIEFIASFAEPLPMMIIAEALGFPRIDLPRLKRWSAAWVKPFSRGLSVEEEVEAVGTHIEFQQYIHDTIVRKRAEPQDDVISHLANGEFADPLTGEPRKLSDAEIIGISDHLLTGGNETTTFALSSGLWLMFRQPELQQQLRDDRSKIRIFVEEALRVESPTQGLVRFAARDIEFQGVKIPKGAAVQVRYGAANRDADRFPDPGTVRLDRRAAASHFAFGAGEHVCPGAALSRFEQNLAWNILFDRIENIRAVPEKDDYRHLPGFWLRALEKIHMRFDKVTVDA